MIAFKKIICPIDLSENSQTVVALASSIAKMSGAKLYFVHVDPPPLPREALYATDEMDALIEKHEKRLKQIAPSESDIEIQHVILRGDAAAEVLRFADEQNCDLIVMSTHGRTGITRFLMGSVAEQIVRASKIPVMSVRYPNHIVEETKSQAL